MGNDFFVWVKSKLDGSQRMAMIIKIETKKAIIDVETNILK